jgi:putative ABC transport system ATP-binding protein
MIRLEKVSKVYRTTDHDTIAALQGVDLTVEPGEMVAVTGPSGSGTSTLMNVLSCLDLPSDGRYLLDGADVARLSKRALAKIRGRKIGFVFQSFKLIPNSNVQHNVELPLLYTRAKVRRQRARVALDRVGLRGHYDDNPVELFAAQQQKAVIARALINDPAILLDDEPTGDLDADSVIYSAHDEDTVAYAKRVVRLRAGRVVSDQANRARRRPRHNPPQLRAV